MYYKKGRKFCQKQKNKDYAMDINKLRALQAPKKERYEKYPETAMVSTQAEGVIKGDDIACRISTHAGTTIAGLHSATGGDGSQACSADMLMESLVACAGVTLKAVAIAMRIPFKHAKVLAEGKWDARGTLGVERSAPVGLSEIKLTFEIDSPVDGKKLKKLVQLTERFCVIYQTLKTPPRLTTQYRAIENI